MRSESKLCDTEFYVESCLKDFSVAEFSLIQISFPENIEPK